MWKTYLNYTVSSFQQSNTKFNRLWENLIAGILYD